MYTIAMYRRPHANGVVTYTFESLAAFPVNAHVSTRLGGVSPHPWHSLNFSVLRGDSRERVAKNRARLAAALRLDAHGFVHCRQVHGTGIAKVSAEDAGTVIDGSDGLTTDVTGLPLSLVFADCVPILLYDPEHHALGVCHAGWRGTVNGTVLALLWTMQAAYATDATQILAAIGPSIGPDSYEVGDEVFTMAHTKLAAAGRFFHYPSGVDAKPYFNLWHANASQLEAAGVPADQIEVSGIDTARTTDEFFSHRAERGRCGLFSMVAWLGSPTGNQGAPKPQTPPNGDSA